MSLTKFVVFDLANTLIYKPSVYTNIRNSLLRWGVDISKRGIIRTHRMLTEMVVFPDVTSREFYIDFNEKLLILLGVLPARSLVIDIYESCKNQPWVPFKDVAVLGEFDHKKFILSNFNDQVSEIIDTYFPRTFDQVFASHESFYRKPDRLFYQECIEALSCKPGDILYIGDSPALDLVPALQSGMRALLIDRDGLFAPTVYRISSLYEISKHL